MNKVTKNILIIGGIAILSSCATTKVEKKCCDKESKVNKLVKELKNE
jgi:hypothetical protein